MPDTLGAQAPRPPRIVRGASSRTRTPVRARGRRKCAEAKRFSRGRTTSSPTAWSESCLQSVTDLRLATLLPAQWGGRSVAGYESVHGNRPSIPRHRQSVIRCEEVVCIVTLRRCIAAVW